MSDPRRQLVAVFAIVLGISALASIDAANAGERAKSDLAAPNVLVINLDDATEKMLDWRKPDGSWVMPNVQEFAAESTVYANTVVDIPSCCPSRFSLFTGRYPHNTGARRQADGVDLPVRQTFVYQLKKAGYATAMAGKFFVSWPITRRPPSFDAYSLMTDGYVDPVINRNGVIATVPGYSTTLLANDLRSYLTDFETASDAKPWYAYWAPQAPHIYGGWKTLAIPEEQYGEVDMGTCAQPVETDRSDKPPYVRFTPIDTEYNQAVCTSQLRAMITVDDRFGEIIAQLRADHEYDRTMVVLTSDNGYHWGEQGWFSKFFPYEASISIPLVVKWPAALDQPTGVDTRPALSLDLTAAIFDVTNTEPVKPLDGKSLLLAPTRQERFVEYFVDTDNGDGIPSWSLLRSETWKYVETRTKEDDGTITLFKEYYDLVADPGELTNVLNDGVVGNEPPRSVLRDLAKRLRAARACSGADCP